MNNEMVMKWRGGTNLLHCRQKPQPLCETIEKGIGETRKCGHRLIMHSITHRDEMWGGGGRRQWEGRGGLCQLIYEPGEMV